MGIHPAKLANYNDGLTDVKILHINIDGGRNRIDDTDQKNLKENLQKINLNLNEYIFL